MASNVSELSVSSMLLLSANVCSSNGFASAFLPLAPYKPHISTTYHYIKSKNIKPTAITTKCIFDRQTVQTHLIHWSVWYCLRWLQLVLLWIHFENKQNVIFVNVDVHLLKEIFWTFFRSCFDHLLFLTFGLLLRLLWTFVEVREWKRREKTGHIE